MKERNYISIVGKFATLIFGGIFCVRFLPLAAMITLHSRHDSEVGVMLYGFRALEIAMTSVPILFVSASVWFTGLKVTARNSGSVRRWETWFSLGVLIISAAAIIRFFELYRHLFISWFTG